MSARRRKIKAQEKKVANFFFVLFSLAVIVATIWVTAVEGPTTIAVFFLEVIGWLLTAALMLTAVTLLGSAVRGNSRGRHLGWAFTLIVLPLLVVLVGSRDVSKVRLYLLGNVVAAMLLSFSMSTDVLSPE